MKCFAKGLLFTLIVAGAGAANAEPADDACTALMSARVHLVGLVGPTDKITFDNHIEKVHSASAKLDAVLAAMIHGQNANDAAKAGEFQIVWEAFKSTREKEIIPAVYAGKIKDARTIAMGIQAERKRKMMTIMGCKQRI